MDLWAKRDEWQRIGVTGTLSLSDPTAGDSRAERGRAAILPFSENGAPRAALISAAGTGVTVNGYPPLGAVVLEDRDEVAINGTLFVFVTRSPTEALPFPQSDIGERCGRCKRPLRVGETAIQCPACRAWHHTDFDGVTARGDCWGYDPRCGGCQRERATLIWSPVEEDVDA
jgi:hypothetical protein